MELKKRNEPSSMFWKEESKKMENRKQTLIVKCWKSAWTLFSEYCANSSIHGTKYLAEKNLHWVERLFWLIILMASSCMFTLLTMTIWWKWKNDLVIVSDTDTSTRVHEISFPMVTVCPETKSRQSVFNFTDIFWKEQDFKNLTQGELDRFKVFSLICDESLSEFYELHNTTANHDRMNFMDDRELYNILDESMPQLETTIQKCRWGNEGRDCGKLFSQYLIEEGICYSFNALNPLKDLTDDYVFNPELPKDKVENPKDPNGNVYPYIVRGLGSRNGLEFMLWTDNRDHDFLCRMTQGFKIMLNIPGEVPEPLKHYIFVPKGYIVSVIVTPEVIKTETDLKSYNPSSRRCYFEGERNLRYFHTYTQNNCQLECLSNFTSQKCGCVKFSMPRHVGIPLCGVRTNRCLREAEDELALGDFLNDVGKLANHTRCKCLPSCNSVVYEVEISLKRNLDHKLKNSNLSKVLIYFVDKKVPTTNRYRNSQISSTADFIADLGNLLSLFMGFSILSFVEIIYFFTFRLFSKIFEK